MNLVTNRFDHIPVLKELGAKRMVEMAEYFGENPQIIDIHSVRE